MKGDFTRFTFDPKRHYNRVLMQQGRVILDADWNEQADIQEHIRETEVADVVGRSGAPIDFAGFKVEVAPGGRDLILSSGRMYVDGILCELDEDLRYFEKVAFPSEKQAKLPSQNIDDIGLEKGQWIEISVKDDLQLQPQMLKIEEINAAESILTFNEKVNDNLSAEATSSGIYIKIFSKIEDQPDIDVQASETCLAYLDVWDRHITAVEDDDIREKALDGPDTTTRIKTEWGVRLVPCELENISCREASLKLKNLTNPRDSRLAVRLQPSQREFAEDPCAALSGTAYRGLENQLYRVEIHKPGEVGEATFKWSRNNGAIAFAIVGFIEDDSASKESVNAETKTEPKLYYKVKLQQLGWDQELRIHKDDWVEVLGDETELLGEPGTLARVEDIDESDLILTLTADVSKHLEESNPKVRRWDLSESKLEESQFENGIPMPTKTGSEDCVWIELEYGIEVCFKTGDHYKTGDYWLIPARNTGEIEWPYSENDFVPKFGIQHHNCLLAILTRNQDGTWNLEKDCRKLFPPLTDMVFLSYAGGDGQEGMPGKELPSSLQVRVHRGGRPVVGAEVRFEIVKGEGELRASENVFARQKTLIIITGEDGIARCLWKYGEDQPEGDLIWMEQVKATLLSPELERPPSIQFSANAAAASLSYVGGDGQEAMPGEELPVPLLVRVFVGGYPLNKAEVEFKILKGDGELRSSENVFAGQKTLTVTTGEDGIARCLWKFGADRPEGDLIWTEQVEATLINPKQEHSPSILFSANVIALFLSYVGGDGQEAMPGYNMPAPFRVRVSRGERPVEGAEIVFEILEGQGALNPAGSVLTGKDGIAQCTCQFNSKLEILYLRVRAALIDVVCPDEDGAPSHPSIIFNANASVAEEVAYVPPIACSQLKDVKTVKDAIDGLCRQVSFSCVGGDGQEAMPGYELPGPLRVRVSRGSYPVIGARVMFKIDGKKGKLREISGGTDKDELEVSTDENGIATCFCRLYKNAAIEARLLEPTPLDRSSIWFNANVRVAEEVAYAPSTACPQLSGVNNVKDAIDGLCKTISEITSRIVWVHGSSLQVEKMVGEIAVARENYATVVRVPKGSKARMHFSISTIQPPGGAFPVAQEALIRLKASSLSVAAYVYDGENPISDRAVIVISENWETKHIILPYKQITTGLGISIIAECTEGSGQIEFSAAGCILLSNW
jgi:hypothetical protein